MERVAWIRVIAALGVLGLGLAVPARGQEPSPGAATLDLSIRARALGVVPEGVSREANLGLEPERAPTGAGTTRMPRAASGRAPGVYLGVAVCEPGGLRVYQVRVDEPWELPEGSLRGTPGPRALFIPGRPTP